MFSLACFNIRFTPSWQMSLLTLFSLLFFMRLGFWQLQRADEKERMLSAHHAFTKQTPVLWRHGDPLPAQYQPINVTGHFLPAVLLLDNQHHHHQFGYDVISPLLLQNGAILLVDRGWLAGDITRMTFPPIKTPKDAVNIVGSAYYPSAKNWVLGQEIEKKQTNLAVIELIDTKLISQFLHKSVYPFIIRLNPEEALGYVREWEIVAMPPQRHHAYALQWFAIALVILTLFIVLNIHSTTAKKKI